MGKIVAVNASPRIKFNTGSLVREAARGAESQGAQVQTFDLARLEKHSGCMSCFACKLAPNEGTCVFKDGLAPVLSAIREADGLIVGTPTTWVMLRPSLKRCSSDWSSSVSPIVMNRVSTIFGAFPRCSS